MEILSSPQQYLFNLHTTSSAEARRLWRRKINERWGCNQDKAHTPWEDWYFSQEFFSLMRYSEVINWMKPDPPTNLFQYRPRRNNAS